MNYEARRARMSDEFSARFDGETRGWVRAPGRAELLGTDTDDHLGYVMTMSIHLDTWIVFSPSQSQRCRIYSMNLDESAEFEIGKEPDGPEARWDRYVSGVAAAFDRRGYECRGIDAVIHGTVPVGGGLSSSASLEVAAAHAFAEAGGFSPPPQVIAQVSQEAENRSVGVACGILDQYSAEMGKEGTAILLDCRALSHIDVRVPQDIKIIICDTNYPRTLSDSGYARRREECDEATRLLREMDASIRTLRDVNEKKLSVLERGLPEVLATRARFIVEENQRVVDFTSAVVRDDREAMRQLCAASFAGMRDLYDKTVPAMERMYEAMTAADGCIAARQSGGGFGGCMVAYVQEDAVEAFCTNVAAAYQKRSGLKPSIYPTEPSAGAGAPAFD